MSISLSKGQKVDLTKTNPGLTKVVVGVGWDTNKYDGGRISIWMFPFSQLMQLVK